MKIVAKFGGSSLADAQQFAKVKKIITADVNRRLVVVSAAGKGVHEPIKLTDQLIDIYHAYHDNQDYQVLWHAVQVRLHNLTLQLGLEIPLQAKLTAIINHLADLSYAELVSRGEYLTATIMSAYLGWPMLDSQDFLVLHDDGQVDFAASQVRFAKQMRKYNHVVIPGFYGVNAQNEIKLLPRGGGDTTGAIVANLVNADRYENWTDTNGILITDPHLIDHPKSIRILSYNELQELAYLGMQVFQQEAIQPVRDKNVPVAIKNTNDPQLPGTLVVANKNFSDQQFITGIAGQRNQILMVIHKYQLTKHIDQLFGLLEAVRKINPKFTYAFNGTDTLSITLDNWTDKRDQQLALNQIKTFLQPEKIDVNRSLSMIGLVTDRLQNDPMIVGTIVNHLRDHHIKVHSIVQGNGEDKVILGVKNADYQRTIQILYDLTQQQALKSEYQMA